MKHSRISKLMAIWALCVFMVGTVLAHSTQNGSVIDNFGTLTLSDTHAQKTFQQCLPFNLSDKIIKEEPVDHTYYIITGDISAMWVRDSCAQIYPYVYLSKNDAHLQKIIQGTIRRHMKHFNSAYPDAPFINSWSEDYSPHEYKYEPDGIAYLIRLAWLYWKVTGDETWAHETGSDFDAHSAFNQALKVLQENTGPTGMIKCKHRPSDDATRYPYLIPTNMFLASMLPKLAEMYSAIWNDPTRSDTCKAMSKTIREGINTYGIYNHPLFGNIWVYETDGNGNSFAIDDANIPSLLSAPYLEFCDFSDPVYQNTRRFILSQFNTYYYYLDAFAGGIGSPHTRYFWVWPVSIIMQALTSNDENEVPQMFKYLNSLDSGAFSVHESVNLHNPAEHTRDSFGWGNALYTELIIKKTLGLNFYPDNKTSYIKPYLHSGCTQAELNNPVDFGSRSGITLHLSGNGSRIDSATINGKAVRKEAIDKVKGIKIPEDNVDIVIHTVNASL